MKESHKNMIGFSSMHVHVCVKLESKYIDTHKLVAGVTGHVFTTLKVLLSNYRSRYEGGWFPQLHSFTLPRVQSFHLCRLTETFAIPISILFPVQLLPPLIRYASDVYSE